MSSTLKNRAILAAAGSRKTEYVIDSALRVTDGRVLIMTYTNENQRHIIHRIHQRLGVVPTHITVMGWFTFLISQCVRPYQRAITGEPLLIGGLNFKGRRNRFTPKAALAYYLDAAHDMYRDGVAEFVVALDRKTDGAVIARLERVVRYIFIDEVQDLGGYDLDVLDLLLGSMLNVTLVGDLRQHTLATNIGSRNKKYRDAGLLNWFGERSGLCALESRDCSYRCNQEICDFGDALYPEFPRTTSVDVPSTGHDGIFEVAPAEVAGYVRDHEPVVVLRHDKTVDTQGLPAMNIGVAKGSTFERVLIFPTRPMLQYLRDRDEKGLRARERLYVAVTRARFSVAFVVPNVRA